jgi:hypothetical protein
MSACSCYSYKKKKKKNFDGQQLLKNQASHQPPPTSNYETQNTS